MTKLSGAVAGRRSHALFGAAALVALVGGVACGTVFGPEALGAFREWRDRPWKPGASLPDGRIWSGHGDTTTLHAAVLGDGSPTELVLLSATCQNCLGELKAWDDAVRGRTMEAAHVVVVIHTESNEYFLMVDSLIRPAYPVWGMDRRLQERLRAARSPTVYRVAASGAVTGAWVGVDAAAGLRGGFVAATLVRESERPIVADAQKTMKP